MWSHYRFWMLTILLVGPANLQAAEQGIVEVVGEAQIKNNDKMAAKNAARADAFKKAIELVVGVSIRSDFSATQQEVVKNNESEFYSKVRDSLMQNSEGFIEKFDILEEKIDGDMVRIKMKAYVFESKIKARVKKLADLIAAAGNPKLMLVIQEIYITPQGEKKLASDSILAAQLEQELIARGFELKGQKTAQGLTNSGLDEYQNWLNNPTSISKSVAETGADILIGGQIEIKDKGKVEDAGGFEALKGQTKIEITSVIRGINIATGEVFSAKPMQTRSFGISLERAVHRAFQGRGANLVKKTFDQLLVDLKTSFKKSAEKGRGYEVLLSGVKSFRKQGRKFLQLLKKLDGVSGVQQKAFKKGQLIIELRCKCSAVELQDRVFTATESVAPLSEMDIENVVGKKLLFKL